MSKLAAFAILAATVAASDTKAKGGRIMRKLLVLAFLSSAVRSDRRDSRTAKPPGTNGLISFTRFDPALHQDVVCTVNPDGSHEQPLMAGAESGHWSPDGTRIAWWILTVAPSGSSTPTTAATASCRRSTPIWGCSLGAVWSPGRRSACL